VICCEEKLKINFKLKKKKKTWFFKEKYHKGRQSGACQQKKERARPDSGLMESGFGSLKRERDIQAVFLTRKRLSNKNFILYYKIRFDKNVRAVFFVPKKVFKKAWDRNRVRRILKEIFRAYDWNNKGFDIVCVVRDLKAGMLRLNEIEAASLPLLKELVRQ
jgi:ribonuclease P protein component